MSKLKPSMFLYVSQYHNIWRPLCTHHTWLHVIPLMNEQMSFAVSESVQFSMFVNPDTVSQLSVYFLQEIWTRNALKQHTGGNSLVIFYHSFLMFIIRKSLAFVVNGTITV